MLSTAVVLRTMGQLLNFYGRHIGENFVGPHGALDIAAAAYVAVTGEVPAVFSTDEDASLELISGNEQAMDAIRMLSACLDTEPNCISEDDRTPDHIQHICMWASQPAPREQQPPTVSEVIGRLERAATTFENLQAAPAQPATGRPRAPHAA